ncbi:MAG: IS256 family transposase [Actinomycetota bacterium]|jgi:transposase-like protein|nr:IS256 family transposase [Actinomycetota bacterium]
MSASRSTTTPAKNLRLLPGLGFVDLAASGLPERLAEKVEGELELFAYQMRYGLLSAAVSVGLEVFGELLQAEVTEIAGPRGTHHPNRRARRHGSESAKVPLGGRMVDVAKPRVRSVDGAHEIPLETWAAVASRDLMERHTIISMLAGVSTRNYATVLEPVGPELEENSSATSRSAVSRRFIAGTKARLEEFRSRPLSDCRWLIVFIDGFGFGDETLVGALGVDEKGNKVPLSVVHGTTENKTVCKKLLDDLEDRGFDASAGVLFVIDGGKAIARAIEDKWGDTALIQRCRQHKYRNVTDLLPKSDHAWVKIQMNRAWRMPDPDGAEEALRSLAAKLERTHPDAAASLREGLEETVTINALGVTGTLAATLATTNPIESTIDIIKVHARNVKRWRGGDMRLRWAAAGMLAAEAQYHRVRGHRQLDKLAQALSTAIQRRRELADAS